MAYITPPPTTSPKKRGLFGSKRSPEYYEDIYGERNVDEAFDRFPDRCESESDDEDYTMSGFRESGEYQSLLGSREKMAVRAGNQPAGEKDDTLFVTDDEAEEDEQNAQYKIAPNVNPKTSVKLLSPKKNGFFNRSDYVQQEQKKVKEQSGRSIAGDVQAGLEKHVSKRGRGRPRPAAASEHRIKRSNDRQLIQKQLADLAKERKEARRAERKAEREAAEAAASARRESKSKKSESKSKKSKSKSKKTTHKLHYKEVLAMLDAKQHGGMVYVDNSHIDPTEYTRYD